MDRHGPDHDDQERLARRVEKMRAAGRITQEEAARVRAATECSGDVGSAINEIRLRHVRVWLTTAVADGRVTQAEADDALARLAAGEDPSALRELRRRS